ncbi:MAG TPA: zinc ribbon domain-containing protein [Anaeromyxobacteraceae bacterium]|nr:zinc ribbon domain-containing protein [Anaeromyxobacteraceae bacterium]
MPLYEYACACGHSFEELIVRRSDEDEVRCPRCQGRDVHRLMSRPAASRSSGGGSSSSSSCGPVG